jgi:hypothetical protein
MHVYRLLFSFSLPLAGGAGLESLSSMALRNLGSVGKGMFKIPIKNNFIHGKLCYYLNDKRIRLKESKIFDISLAPKSPKNHFLTAATKVAA